MDIVWSDRCWPSYIVRVKYLHVRPLWSKHCGAHDELCILLKQTAHQRARKQRWLRACVAPWGAARAITKPPPPPLPSPPSLRPPPPEEADGQSPLGGRRWRGTLVARRASSFLDEGLHPAAVASGQAQASRGGGPGLGGGAVSSSPSSGEWGAALRLAIVDLVRRIWISRWRLSGGLRRRFFGVRRPAVRAGCLGSPPSAGGAAVVAACHSSWMAARRHRDGGGCGAVALVACGGAAVRGTDPGGAPAVLVWWPAGERLVVFPARSCSFDGSRRRPGHGSGRGCPRSDAWWSASSSVGCRRRCGLAAAARREDGGVAAPLFGGGCGAAMTACGAVVVLQAV
ncbi:uncharacterized protein [Triticum aestivum]|uniref:uncharacterized protein n=1 Tax=Triticum aestivum TaxID=4565 RepID=UPI001D020081|nr:uncharacterized protein LOC123114985 [Triticum aestivum]